MADNKNIIYKREVHRITLQDPSRFTNPAQCVSEERILEENNYFQASSNFKDKTLKLKHSDSVTYERNLRIERSNYKKEFTCEVCGIICTGIGNFKLHIEGKKHIKKLKEEKILQKMEPIPRNIPTTRNCDLCEKKFANLEANMQHCKSEAPQEISSLYGLMKSMKLEDPSQFSEAAKCTKSSLIHCNACKKWSKSPMTYDCYVETSEHYRKGQNLKEFAVIRGVINTSEEGCSLSCETCCKAFNGPVPYKQHLMSNTHSKKEDIAKEMMRMSIIQSSELHCKDCGKKFSGVVPFNDHLRGSSHKRLIKKKIMLKNLEEEHPEVFNYSMFGIHNEDAKSEGDGKLDCKACHLEFKKFEDVQEHYSGVKHREIMKEKGQVKKSQKFITKQESLEVENAERLSESDDSSDEPLIEL